MARKKLVSNSAQNVGYILVKCELGLEEKVVNSLRKVDGVAEVEQVYGSPYDIIVKLVCKNPKKLEDAVWRVRRIARVISTETMMVAEL